MLVDFIDTSESLSEYKASNFLGYFTLITFDETKRKGKRKKEKSKTEKRTTNNPLLLIKYYPNLYNSVCIADFLFIITIRHSIYEIYHLQEIVNNSYMKNNNE